MALEEQTEMTRYRDLVADGLVTIGTGYAMLAIFAAVGGVGAALQLAKNIGGGEESASATDAYDRNMERSRAAREAVAAAQLATVAA